MRSLHDSLPICRSLEIASDLLFFAVRVERGRDTSLDFARDERCFRHGPIHRIDIGKPFGQLQRGLETVGKPGLYAVAADEAVHHHLAIVLQLLVERGSLVDLEELAVDADALEARFPPFGQFLAVFALAAAHHWRKRSEEQTSELQSLMS